jgi:hypothetical protein
LLSSADPHQLHQHGLQVMFEIYWRAYVLTIIFFLLFKTKNWPRKTSHHLRRSTEARFVQLLIFSVIQDRIVSQLQVKRSSFFYCLQNVL